MACNTGSGESSTLVYPRHPRKPSKQHGPVAVPVALALLNFTVAPLSAAELLPRSDVMKLRGVTTAIPVA